MKIAQITWITFPNYGTFLQAYALQQVIKQLGHQTHIIDDRRLTWLYPSVTNICRWAKMVLRNPRESFKLLMQPLPFRQFKNQWLTLDKEWESTEDLARRYDTFICGSDQIWSSLLPNHYNGFYFASFAPSSARKIAYAPSLGSKSPDEEYKNLIRRWLASFKSLSAREQSGAEILRSITGRKDIVVTLDPTLLLSSGHWNNLINTARHNDTPSEPYILAYFLTYNETYLRRARDLADKHGYKLIAIDSGIDTTKYADITLSKLSPTDFLNLIAGAASVATDSFHGTIFSIHFHRPFITFKRFTDLASNSQNARLENLFSILGITDNFIDADSIDIIPATPDWTNIESRLERHRAKSIAYLKNALS